MRLAESRDGDRFTKVVELGAAYAGEIADASKALCGASICRGRWLYEIPWLVEDASDPDAGRRLKVFAHKYFFYAPAKLEGTRSGKFGATRYEMGSIVMWTAAGPAGKWSEEQTVLRWPLSPPGNGPSTLAGDLDPALRPCTFFSEGGVSVGEAGLGSGPLLFL